MAIRDIFKISRKTFLNPSAWIDMDSLRLYNNTLKRFLTPLFIPAKPQIEETFEQAMERQGVTEEDIQSAQKNYYNYAILFVIISCLAVLFGFYLLFMHGTFAGWLLSFAAAALFLAQAFKFHFWYFQIKHRKLGCTFQEWKKGKIIEKGPPA